MEFGHVGDRCSFDAIIRAYEIADPALDRLATIVRGADTSRPDLTPQCEGLLAISYGLSSNFPDDHEMLKHGMVMYDALYTWCRLQSEKQCEVIMAMKAVATIEIPGSAGSSFDHGAFDPKSRRVFVAHTGRDCVEVIDHDAGKHSRNAAGVSRKPPVSSRTTAWSWSPTAAPQAWLSSMQHTLETQRVFKVGAKPNGVAIVARQKLAIAACIGDDSHRPTLHVVGLDGDAHHSIDLPGRPRWCVTDAAATRVFLAIQEPSMVLTARLPDLQDIKHWKVPSAGAHGLEIDHQHGRLYVACDDATLVEVDAGSGQVSNQWPIAGAPDVTFFNPATGLVHVAIGKPGLVQSIDPRTGASTQTMTAAGAHTTALVPPDRLYVFSPSDGGAIVLVDR